MGRGELVSPVGPFRCTASSFSLLWSLGHVIRQRPCLVTNKHTAKRALLLLTLKAFSCFGVPALQNLEENQMQRFNIFRVHGDD